jgi:hypothetical protein
LRLLNHIPFRRRTVQPDRDKCQPTGNGNPDTSNPDPRTANLPTPWPLVVGKVAYCDLPLLVDVCEEWAAVVDAEVEDTMLVGCLECDAENGGVCGLCHWGEVQALEGREHGKLELNVVGRGGGEGLEVIMVILGDLDLKVLVWCQCWYQGLRTIVLTTSVLTR